jgi:hypothetical protein
VYSRTFISVSFTTKMAVLSIPNLDMYKTGASL